MTAQRPLALKEIETVSQTQGPASGTDKVTGTQEFDATRAMLETGNWNRWNGFR